MILFEKLKVQVLTMRKCVHYIGWRPEHFPVGKPCTPMHLVTNWHVKSCMMSKWLKTQCHSQRQKLYLAWNMTSWEQIQITWIEASVAYGHKHFQQKLHPETFILDPCVPFVPVLSPKSKSVLQTQNQEKLKSTTILAQVQMSTEGCTKVQQ